MTDPIYNPYRSNQDGLFMFRYEEGDKTVTFEVGGGQHLSHMLNEIKLFLQASGYGFHANEDLEVVDNSYSNDEQRDEWADADLDGWGEEEKENWQAPGQEWETNGWDDERGIWSRTPREKNGDWQVDGPTEFGFNGTKESDLNQITPIVDESGIRIGEAGKKRE